LNLRHRRVWYVVAAIIVLIIVGYAAGWFGREPVPPMVPDEPVPPMAPE
jgi:hypothetical protein